MLGKANLPKPPVRRKPRPAATHPKLTPKPCSTIGAIVPNMTAPMTVAPMAMETADVATVVAPGVRNTLTKDAADKTTAEATAARASLQMTRNLLPWWISPVASPRITIAELWARKKKSDRGKKRMTQFIWTRVPRISFLFCSCFCTCFISLGG